MNSCEHYQELISRLADNELSREENDALMEHLNSCPRCNAMYAVFLDLSQLISEEAQPLPDGLHENIMAGVRRSAIIKKNRRLRRFGLRTAVSAAACAVLVLFAATGFDPAKRAGSVSVSEQETASVVVTPAPAEFTAREYAPPAMTPAPMPTQMPAPANADIYYPTENTYTPQQPETNTYSNYNTYNDYSDSGAWQQPEVNTQWAAPQQAYTAEEPAVSQPLTVSEYAAYDNRVPVYSTPAAPEPPAPAERTAGTEAAGLSVGDTQTFNVGPEAAQSSEAPQVTPDLSVSLYALPAEASAGKAEEEPREEDETVPFFSLFSSSDDAFDAAPPAAEQPAEDMEARVGELAVPEGADAAAPAEIFTALTAPAATPDPVKEERLSVYGKADRAKLLAMIGSKQATVLPAEAELTRVVHVSFVPEDSYGSEEKMDINIYGDFIFCHYYPVDGDELTWYADCSLTNLDSFLDACRAAAPSPTPTADPYIPETPAP